MAQINATLSSTRTMIALAIPSPSSLELFSSWTSTDFLDSSFNAVGSDTDISDVCDAQCGCSTERAIIIESQCWDYNDGLIIVVVLVVVALVFDRVDCGALPSTFENCSYFLETA